MFGVWLLKRTLRKHAAHIAARQSIIAGHIEMGDSEALMRDAYFLARSADYIQWGEIQLAAKGVRDSVEVANCVNAHTLATNLLRSSFK
ncbi:hypothetical protein [Herbiconiux daphne]|uniref:Acyl-CoA dehydrogenase/oxidase C-terminal domain-containing protein n=1 Tax=Herbiconiux daphne TaxID=2970914 RepID=A0ABT2H908_9MICO|nr:hypothetical protein [Herbiconiux daphne]MCS5736441.1 hypothetical protein [Herbiconiux daphne]